MTVCSEGRKGKLARPAGLGDGERGRPCDERACPATYERCRDVPVAAKAQAKWSFGRRSERAHAMPAATTPEVAAAPP